MATTLQYNSIDFGLVKSIRLGQVPKMDDSDTDQIWTVFTLEVESVLSVLDDGTEIGGDNKSGADGPGGLDAYIRHKLTRPRRKLKYTVSDEVVLEVTTPAGNNSAEVLDANNGPKIRDCTVTSITERTFRIHWVCEVALADCDQTSQKFASHRWQTETQIDGKGYTTRTTVGTIQTRSDMRENPDQLRGLCAPPLLRDFHREYTFTLQKDGLALHYTIRDVQKYLLPPKGVVHADGQFSITTQPPGAVFWAQCDVHLEGRKAFPKKDLLQLATVMCLNRIEAARPVNDSKRRPAVMGGAFSEKLFENSVSVSLRAQLNTSHRIKTKSPLVEAGKKAAGRTAKAAGQGVNAIVNAVGGGLGGWIMDRLKQDNADANKARVDAERAAAVQAAGQEAEALIQAPPTRAFGEPLTGTQFEADGIDPGVWGNLEQNLALVLLAQFRDPCVSDGTNARPTLTTLPVTLSSTLQGVDGRGRDKEEQDVLAAEDMLDTIATTSTLRNFQVVDQLERFEKLIGLAGNDFLPGNYTSWFCEVCYESKTHRWTGVTTVPGQLRRWGHLANPELNVVVKWTGEKSTNPPEVPVCVDPNLIHKGDEIEASAVSLAADGVTLAYQVRGISRYEALDPEKVVVRGVIPPWMQGSMSDVPEPIPMLINVSTDPVTTAVLQSGGIPGVAPVNP
jgi:hypothetical protein